MDTSYADTAHLAGVFSGRVCFLALFAAIAGEGYLAFLLLLISLGLLMFFAGQR